MPQFTVPKWLHVVLTVLALAITVVLYLVSKGNVVLPAGVKMLSDSLTTICWGNVKFRLLGVSVPDVSRVMVVRRSSSRYIRCSASSIMLGTA